MNRKFLKVVVGLLGHVTPAIFFRRIVRSEALVYTSVFFSEQPFYGNYSTLDSHLVKMASKAVKRSIQLFLGVAEFKCFLLVCDVVWFIVQHLFIFLYCHLVIAPVCNTKKLPRFVYWLVF